MHLSLSGEGGNLGFLIGLCFWARGRATVFSLFSWLEQSAPCLEVFFLAKLPLSWSLGRESGLLLGFLVPVLIGVSE